MAKSFASQGLCSRISKVLLLSVIFLLFWLLWFEFPHQQRIVHENVELRMELDLLRADRSVVLAQSFAEPVALRRGPSTILNSTNQDQRFSGHKLVHIDLKGAPPKMDYLLKVLPVMQELGATGLLVEYEDAFPYSGPIQTLASVNAYSDGDIESFLRKASELHLQVIPLVPTFGHLEFVLKHGQFAHLRESSKHANAPCPLNDETRTLIFSMIDQVLERHGNSKYIHVGGDEVFNLKDCNKCRSDRRSKADLFVYHMSEVFKYVKLKSNGNVKPIMWDDMMRGLSQSHINELAKHADVMVWGYVPSLKSYYPSDMWTRYQNAFKQIWISSSFKGALRPNNNLPPLSMHVKNHEAWLSLIREIPDKSAIVGIALTGWSRYDHFATLCELLPASLPSLGLSLSVLAEGSFKLRGKDRVESCLGFSRPLDVEKSPFSSHDVSVPSFPGGDVYALVSELENHISWYSDTKIRFDSWLNLRQVRGRSVSTIQADGIQETLNQLVPSFNSFKAKCEQVLPVYYHEDTVREWIADKVDFYIALTKTLAKDLEKQLQALRN